MTATFQPIAYGPTYRAEMDALEKSDPRPLAKKVAALCVKSRALHFERSDCMPPSFTALVEVEQSFATYPNRERCEFCRKAMSLRPVESWLFAASPNGLRVVAPRVCPCGFTAKPLGMVF